MQEGGTVSPPTKDIEYVSPPYQLLSALVS